MTFHHSRVSYRSRDSPLLKRWSNLGPSRGLGMWENDRQDAVNSRYARVPYPGVYIASRLRARNRSIYHWFLSEENEARVGTVIKCAHGALEVDGTSDGIFWVVEVCLLDTDTSVIGAGVPNEKTSTWIVCPVSVSAVVCLPRLGQ